MLGMQPDFQGCAPASLHRHAGVSETPSPPPEGGLSVPDQDVRMPDDDDQTLLDTYGPDAAWRKSEPRPAGDLDGSPAVSPAAPGEDADLGAAIFELALLLKEVEIECAKISARIRRLERRPVITVQHDYREGI